MTSHISSRKLKQKVVLYQDNDPHIDHSTMPSSAMPTKKITSQRPKITMNLTDTNYSGVGFRSAQFGKFTKTFSFSFNQNRTSR